MDVRMYIIYKVAKLLKFEKKFDALVFSSEENICVTDLKAENEDIGEEDTNASNQEYQQFLFKKMELNFDQGFFSFHCILTF